MGLGRTGGLAVIGRSAGKVKSPVPTSIALVRPQPDRIDRLPEQYFARLLARVADAAALEGDEVVDLGRGNPDIGPPQHVIDAAARAANDQTAHGYPPFRGIPELKEAIAGRYRDVYGVELDPEREVAVVPGTKTAIVEVAMCLAERGETILLPDPGYPDYTSGVALAAAREGRVRLDPEADFAPELPTEGAAALYLNYPSNPCAASAPAGSLRGDRALGGADGDVRPARLRLRRPRVRRTAAGELPRRAGRAGDRRGDVLHVEDLRHGRLAARLRRRERRARRAAQPAGRPRARRRLPADPGGGSRRADRAAGVGRGAPRDLRAPARPGRRVRSRARERTRRSSSGGASRRG